MGVRGDNLSCSAAAEEGIAAVKRLSQRLGIPSNLKELGVKPEDFAMMAENAMKDVCSLTNHAQPPKSRLSKYSVRLTKESNTAILWWWVVRTLPERNGLFFRPGHADEACVNL